MLGQNPGRLGNRHASIAPYETFEASDGYFNVAVGNDAQFRRLCELLGTPELLGDARFADNPTRVRHREVLSALLGDRFRRSPRAAWISKLTAAGIPCGEVNDLQQALSHPQLRARGVIAEMQHPVAGELRVVGSPLRAALGHGPQKVTAPPLLGQHTREVLGELLSLSKGELEKLEAERVIASLSERA
jgi:crotonobetainyl-CoA:carnitine CoA-transferase CaiB-like acyl-CoA transferase